jgi:hypothetical protein
VGIGSVGSKVAYSAELKKHMYLSKENMLKAAASAHYVPVRIEVVCERNTSCKPDISRWRNAHFLPNKSIS